MQMREAVPGVMRLPTGSRDRERMDSLEARVSKLEREKGGVLASPFTPLDFSDLYQRLDELEAKLIARKPGRPKKED